MPDYPYITITDDHMRKIMEEHFGSKELSVIKVQGTPQGFELTLRERKPKAPPQTL